MTAGLSDPRLECGRPRLRWDDYIYQFRAFKFGTTRDDHWFEVLCNKDMKALEQEFVTFLNT